MILFPFLKCFIYLFIKRTFEFQPILPNFCFAECVAQKMFYFYLKINKNQMFILNSLMFVVVTDSFLWPFIIVKLSGRCFVFLWDYLNYFNIKEHECSGTVAGFKRKLLYKFIIFFNDIYELIKNWFVYSNSTRAWRIIGRYSIDPY